MPRLQDITILISYTNISILHPMGWGFSAEYSIEDMSN